MYDPNISVLREAFLSRILEQFRKLAGDIVAPYRAEAWTVRDEALNKAVLRVSREGKGEEDEVLGVVACFDDAGAKLAGWRERFSLLWEWKDEVSEVLGLGWKSSAPDAQAGLDSSADQLDDESEYVMGKVSAALRVDVMAALKV